MGSHESLKRGKSRRPCPKGGRPPFMAFWRTCANKQRAGKSLLAPLDLFSRQNFEDRALVPRFQYNLG
jgi:hypothetical protein